MTYRGQVHEHTSGLREDELAHVSMTFFMLEDAKAPTKEMWDRLLAFQKGWKACKDWYKIND